VLFPARKDVRPTFCMNSRLVLDLPRPGGEFQIDALGGSSLGMVICNLAPGDRFAKEALRTLKFATRTREIENKP
jgi:hypothetical protein